MTDALPTHTPDGRPYRIFFVCGHMRSGTNWVSALLNLHPDVNCFGEGPLGHIKTTIEQVKKIDYLYCYNEPYRSVLDSCFADMASNLVRSLSKQKPEASWVGDNTSRQLWPYVPDAHHFYILRDGRDVLTSWTFHQMRINFDIGEPYRSRMAKHTERLREDRDYFKSHPEELFTDEEWVRQSARTWKDFYLTGKCVLDRVERGQVSAKVCALRYETLLLNADSERERMYRFLDLDPIQAAPMSESDNTSPGFKHDRPDWFLRSGKAGDWKIYANDRFRHWFKEEAGDVLIEAGYEQNNNW